MEGSNQKAGLLRRAYNWITGNAQSKVEYLPAAPKKEARSVTGGYQYQFLFSTMYNGEKNLGEIGPIKSYLPDYNALRARSWQSYLENELTITILSKFNRWIVGAGLKLQAEPNKAVLEGEKIKLDPQSFSEVVESRFAVWAQSKISSYNRMVNLHRIAKTAFTNKTVGGDVLVILRVENGNLNVQLVDGFHVQSPQFGNEVFPQMLSNGNKIINGIESNPRGEVVAYHVCKDVGQFERISAKNSQGFTTAYIVYGNEYRIDNNRGMPLISVVLETLKKLDRYKEATVGSAEERQKIVYQIVHKEYSSEEDPRVREMAKISQLITGNNTDDDVPMDEEGRLLATTVAATTNKETYNLPRGAEMKALESKNELYFEPFYRVNTEGICAALNMPPNVAMSKYNDSFSASRAATKDWEHTITTERKDYSDQFYAPIYALWLHLEVLKNKVQAPGYLEAFATGNEMVLGAYRNARFTGPMFPHIDPLKEVNAERAKLGTAGAHIPLTTVEAATEALNGGDSDRNLEQFSAEMKEAERLDIPSSTDVTQETVTDEEE